MNEMSESIRPLFHYSYKNDAIILDSQYNFQGNILAVSNSHGHVYLYNADSEQPSRQHYFSITQDSQAESKNYNAIIKIGWSLPTLNLFATGSVSQTISIYKVLPKNTLQFYKNISIESIPICLAFCPIQSQCILSVGQSDGEIALYNNQLQLIFKVQAHLESVNSLSWQVNLLDMKRNKWVVNNFLSNDKKQQNSFPALLSASSDLHIKLWQFKNNKLAEVGKVKAHEKPIRQVQWKPNLLKIGERTIVSCSEDTNVKIWSLISINNKLTFFQKARSPMKGPVYKAQYNNRGNLLAVSYCVEQQEKVETRIYKQNNGALLQEMTISN